MRFASPTPTQTTSPARQRSVIFMPAPDAVQPEASGSKQRRQPPPAARPRPSGRFGLDLRKREWDASTDEDDASSDDAAGGGRASDSSDDDGRARADDDILTRLERSERRARRVSRSGEASWQQRLPPVPLYVDEIETYDARARSLAWRKSHQAALNHSTRLAALLSPVIVAPPFRQSRSLATSLGEVGSLSANAVDNDDLGEVRQLLEGLRVERAEEERRERGAFERRNKALWDEIEATIESSEQAHLQAARIKQAEADKKALVARQAAEAAEADKRKAQEVAREKEAARVKKAAEDVRAGEEREKRKAEAARLREGGGGLEVKGEEFGRWVDRMKTIKSDILPVVGRNPDFKKACGAVKRQLTPKIGQLTNDRREILRITGEISTILHDASRAGPEVSVWVLNHLSKTLIRQTEAEVTANPAAAWPLARLVVGLFLMGHAEGLGDVLMARLVKKCPWVVPFSPAKQPDQSEAEHRKMLGHLASTQESTAEYTNRQAGLLTLYAAIFSVLPSPSLVPPTPAGHPPYPAYAPALVPAGFRLGAGWSWLAAILRPPLAHLEPTPTLIGALLDVAAPKLLAAYGQQARKLLMAIGRDVLGSEGPTLGGGKNKPGVARLGLKLEEWQRAGFVWKESVPS